MSDGQVGTNGTVTVSNDSNGHRTTRRDGQLIQTTTATASGVQNETNQRTTGIVGKIWSCITGKDKVDSVGGDSATVSRGQIQTSSAAQNVVVGTNEMANNGATREANRISSSTKLAVQGQPATKEKEDDGFFGAIKKRLNAVSDGIKVSTVSVDGNSVKPFKPTGNIIMDMLGMIQWYVDLLVNFVKKNLIQRIIQTIKSEVEKIEAQWKEFMKITDEFTKSLKTAGTNFDSMMGSVKKFLSSPSDENKPKEDALTKESAVKSIAQGDARAKLTELERKS